MRGTIVAVPQFKYRPTAFRRFVFRACGGLVPADLIVRPSFADRVEISAQWATLTTCIHYSIRIFVLISFPSSSKTGSSGLVFTQKLTRAHPYPSTAHFAHLATNEHDAALLPPVSSSARPALVFHRPLPAPRTHRRPKTSPLHWSIQCSHLFGAAGSRTGIEGSRDDPRSQGPRQRTRSEDSELSD
jgi:hypothetical protein